MKKYNQLWIRQMFFVCCAVLLGTLSFPALTHAADTYKYTSEKYGYTIECPQKPIGVIPLSAVSSEENGDVLIFDNDGYNIKKAWIISVDAFKDADVPDLDKISDADRDLLFKKLLSSGYEYAKLVPIDGKNALYTATAGTDKQIKTYIRGTNNRYAAVLVEHPDLTKKSIDAYQKGLISFREVANGTK